MAGLIQGGMAPQQGQQAPQAAQAPQGAPQGQQGAAPRQGGSQVDYDPQSGQQMYQKLTEAMLQSLYGPMLEQAREMLEQQPDQPAEAIGRIVSTLMTTVYQRLADNGNTVPPGVMFQAGMEVAKAVGELASEIGLIPKGQNAEPIEAGFMLAMAKFGQSTAKDMAPEQRQRYAELIQTMQQARKQNRGQQPQGQPQPQQPQGQPQPGMA